MKDFSTHPTPGRFYPISSLDMKLVFSWEIKQVEQKNLETAVWTRYAPKIVRRLGEGWALLLKIPYLPSPLIFGHGLFFFFLTESSFGYTNKIRKNKITQSQLDKYK